MKERIKRLRKALKLTQSEFAKRLGISQGVVANYETGRMSPSAAAFNNICKEFNVSEEWLRTGEGEMFNPRSEDEELEEAIEQMFSAHAPEFRRRLFKILARLSENEWLVLEQVAMRIAAEYSSRDAKEQLNEKNAAQKQRPETEEEYRARLHRELDAQLDDEKKAAGKLSASSPRTVGNITTSRRGINN